MPDRITLYQTTICRDCTSEEEVRAQIRKTVIHEVGHHFGISDPRLEELGWA
jgi:predicted Zn-dependent protease with MMP-like domain